MSEQNQEKPGLVGKLNDVQIGDRIRMWKEQSARFPHYEVSGYINHIEDDFVIHLGSDHPSNCFPHPGRRGLFFHKPYKANRYDLQHFDHYAKQEDVISE